MLKRRGRALRPSRRLWQTLKCLESTPAHRLCLQFGRKLRQERMIVLPQMNRNREAEEELGSFLSSRCVLTVASRAHDGAHGFSFSPSQKKNNKKKKPWGEFGWMFRGINSKITFTIKTVSLSFFCVCVLALEAFAPSYSFACSHASQGHKSPLLELSP